jgi:hypothetical protein
VKLKDGTEKHEPSLVGLWDRALIGLMVYTFARVTAIGMNVEDYYPQGRRWWVRLHEKRQAPRDAGAPRPRCVPLRPSISARGTSSARASAHFFSLLEAQDYVKHYGNGQFAAPVNWAGWMLIGVGW